MTYKKRTIAQQLSAIIALGTVVSIPQVAVGQNMLEEVVVTARKREESLQETPIAVSALSGDAMAELGVRDIADLTKVVPNVDMYTGNGTTGAGNVFIRGVGARNTGVNFDSGVGIYVDGVYLSRPDGAVLDNVDLQSVQVLRGPQGTLFGKNTTGGAILYTTNKPNEEYEGNAEIRVGNFDQLDGKLTLNIPLIEDTLSSRFSVYSTTRDGYVKSVSNGNPGMSDGDEYNDVDRKGAQAQLRWDATDSLVVDVNYTYNRTDQASRGQNCEIVEGIERAGWQSNLQDVSIVIPSTGQSIQDWCRENQALGKDKITANLAPNKYEAEVHSLSVTADWDLDNGMNFKSISAGRTTEGSETNELDAMGIPLLGRSNFGPGGEPRETDAYSQEFQLSGSAFDDQLDFVVGVFGFTEKTDSGTANSPSGPFPNTIFGPQSIFYINQTTELLAENTSASVFSQTDWHFSEFWSLTYGVRYTWEERELERLFRVPDITTLATTGDASSLSNFFYSLPSGTDTFNPNHDYVKAEDPNNPGQDDPLADQKMRVDNSDVTQMISIQRTFEDLGFIDTGTAYFTVAQGFLSGGITDTISITTSQIEEFDPEEVLNYELGFKMDAWDNRLRLNTAIFYTDYTDRQLTTVSINPSTNRPQGALINAKSSSITGIEIETIILPIDNLQVTANITFNKGEIDEYDDTRIYAVPDDSVPPEAGCDRRDLILARIDNCPVDRSNENLPRLPEEVYFLAVQYNWESEYGLVIPMASWSLRTDIDNCFDQASCLSGKYLNDQEDVSASITWISPDESWRVAAYGKNLTDERYIIGGTPLVDLTETAGTVYNLPRTYGIEASYTW